MSKNSDNGCFLIITIITCILCALGGEFGPILYLGGFVLTVFLFVKIIAMFSNQNTTKSKEIYIKQQSTNTRLESLTKTYSLNSKTFKGSITELPIEIVNNYELETIDLITKQKLEISSLINQNPNLKQLILSGPFYFENELTNRTIIEIVNISDTDISILITQISKLFNLKHLTLSNVQGLRNTDLRHFTSLEYLAINNSFKGIINLSNCKKLEHIQFNNNRLTEFPYEYLELKKMKQLSLSNNYIQKISSVKIRPLLNGLKIESLNLSNNRLHDLPIIILKTSTLKKIYIGNNPFSKFKLKMLYRRYPLIISLDYEQQQKIKRTFSPSTVKLFRLIVTVFIGYSPYLLFDSILASALLSFYIMILGGLNFLFKN